MQMRGHFIDSWASRYLCACTLFVLACVDSWLLVWQCLLVTNGLVLFLIATALLGLGIYCLTNAAQAQALGALP
jgi:hypothetical protein